MRIIKSACLSILVIVLASCTSVEPDPSVGIWDLSMDSPAGQVAVALNIVGDGTGSMSSEMFPEAITNDVVVEGNTLTFSLSISAQGQTFPLTFSGTVAGDDLTGAFDSSFGSMGASGKRQ